MTAFGQKSSVTLPDGTRIWLNSGSRVSYSSAFNSRSRTVNLEGEAYFSVARNEQLPFVVQADGMSVTALGTKFNVKAYANEEEVVATLVEGRIRTDAGDESEIVLPENQASYNRSSGAMSVRPVENMELPMAWFNNRSSSAARRWTSSPGPWNACTTSRSSSATMPAAAMPTGDWYTTIRYTTCSTSFRAPRPWTTG